MEQTPSSSSAPEPACSRTSASVTLFDVLCPGTEFLTEDVINNESFMKCVSSSQDSILYFLHLRESYTANQQKGRRSNLRSELQVIQGTIDEIVSQVKEASKLKISTSIGIDTLARTCATKQQKLTHIGQSLLALKALITSGDILNNLRRRVKQQQLTSSGGSGECTVACRHLPDFTWEMAFKGIEDHQNSGLSSFPLSFNELRSVDNTHLY